MPIITPGIILPSGRFLPRDGDGHSKTAIRFCEQYPELAEAMANERDFNPDEFMIIAGCGITAGYNGEPCFKIAEDNEEVNMQELKEEYEKLDFKIQPYWKINPKYKKILSDILKNSVKMQITVRR